MGCDFYTYYVVRIEYKKGDEVKVKSEEIEDTRERHYFWEIGGRRDEDFEELNDYYERLHCQKQQQVEEALRDYPKKEIFKNGRWLCIESSREKYINLYKKYGIAEKDVISIWKEGDFHYR
jgi:hypothetical protein